MHHTAQMLAVCTSCYITSAGEWHAWRGGPALPISDELESCQSTSTEPPKSHRVLPTTAIMGAARARGLGMFWADRSMPYSAGEYSSSVTLPPSL